MFPFSRPRCDGISASWISYFLYEKDCRAYKTEVKLTGLKTRMQRSWSGISVYWGLTFAFIMVLTTEVVCLILSGYFRHSVCGQSLEKLRFKELSCMSRKLVLIVNQDISSHWCTQHPCYILLIAFTKFCSLLSAEVFWMHSVGTDSTVSNK